MNTQNYNIESLEEKLNLNIFINWLEKQFSITDVASDAHDDFADFLIDEINMIINKYPWILTKEGYEIAKQKYGDLNKL